MIGNDIIDLNFARLESNWQRPGFLEKIFTPAEKALIRTAEDSETIVWLLWSMKESVYKIVARKEQRSFFAPKKFHCYFQEPVNKKTSISGSVSYQNHIFKTKSFISPKHINTIAWTLDRHVPHQSTIQLKKTEWLFQRHQTYTRLKEQFAASYHLDQQYLSIQKNEIGVPILLYKNKRLPQTISISHHGNFGSFAF